MKKTKIDVNKAPVELAPRAKNLAFLGLALGMFLASLDQTIVSTALPKIVSQFERLVSSIMFQFFYKMKETLIVLLKDLYSWVIVAYLLTSTAVMPLTGKLSDIFGRKILFQGSVIIFLTGSILCGAAPNMISLIIFRAFQGIGGGRYWWLLY